MATPENTLELESFLPYRLYHLADLVSREFARVYKDRLGLTRPEWRTLAGLGQHGSMTATALGEQSSMHKTKVAIQPARIGPLLDQLTARFPKAAVDQLDGLRFDWDDSWVLIRASNTEPIVRVISPAQS